MGFGTTGRGEKKEVHVSELKMSQGGVSRADRRLKEEDYLIEMVTSEQLRWILLPFSRKRILWDLFMFVLVGKLAPASAPPRQPFTRARCSSHA